MDKKEFYRVLDDEMFDELINYLTKMSKVVEVDSENAKERFRYAKVLVSATYDAMNTFLCEYIGENWEKQLRKYTWCC